MLYFPYVFRKNKNKLSKNCNIHDKNWEISGPYNFWTFVKDNIPDVWNWKFWILFGSKIEVCVCVWLGACPAPWLPQGVCHWNEVIKEVKQIKSELLKQYFLSLKMVVCKDREYIEMECNSENTSDGKDVYVEGNIF